MNVWLRNMEIIMDLTAVLPKGGRFTYAGRDSSWWEWSCTHSRRTVDSQITLYIWLVSSFRPDTSYTSILNLYRQRHCRCRCLNRVAEARRSSEVLVANEHRDSQTRGVHGSFVWVISGSSRHWSRCFWRSDNWQRADVTWLIVVQTRGCLSNPEATVIFGTTLGHRSCNKPQQYRLDWSQLSAQSFIMRLEKGSGLRSAVSGSWLVWRPVWLRAREQIPTLDNTAFDCISSFD